jgi:hypothetical protein
VNNDIRIAITCPDHPKAKKLMRRLGDKAFWNLIKFWCFVALNKPSGDISCCDIEDIEIGAAWEGEEGLFFSTMVDLGFIEVKGKSVFVHDWDIHNGWAVGADARSAKAKLAAKARWDKKNGAPSNATSMDQAEPQEGSSNAPSPSPSPSPIPIPKQTAPEKECVLLFDSFWSMLPKKLGKKDCLTWWMKNCKTTEKAETIISGIEDHLPLWAVTEPQYIPHPKTWLHQERWTDEVVMPVEKVNSMQPRTPREAFDMQGNEIARMLNRERDNERLGNTDSEESGLLLEHKV